MSIAPARMSWKPTATLAKARVRAAMLAAARRFFSTRKILEVETPVLSRAAVSDTNIESIGASLHADPSHEYFLHTSPEFAMKRLLCAGWPDIYQICKVFRDGEVGARHQPEFTLVEWYRRDFRFTAMMQETVDFICTLLDRKQDNFAVAYLSYRDAFLQHVQLDPLTADDTQLRACSGADHALAHALGNDRDSWLDLILSTQIAPRFDKSGLTVLHHYPASQASLARQCPDNPALADRFEVFFGELELANGYFELGNADEQRQRFEQDQHHRARKGAPVRPLDEHLLAALHSGLPDCCGVAVGLDRLVMLRTSSHNLNEVQTFSTIELTDG